MDDDRVDMDVNVGAVSGATRLQHICFNSHARVTEKLCCREGEAWHGGASSRLEMCQYTEATRGTLLPHREHDYKDIVFRNLGRFYAGYIV
jgi:hypothetical protein